jgi:FkbM family methyltransferase
MSTVRRACRAVMRSAVPLGVEDHLKRLRALTNAGLRRDLRDHNAMRLLVAVGLAHDGHGIDVGAHEGSVLREMSRLAPMGRHLGFEPIPELRQRLEREFGEGSNVEIRGTALSDTAGEATFHHVVTAPGYSGLRRREMSPGEEVRPITVTTARLDDVLPDGFEPALIKIDVEGAELLVLRGAAETVARYKPIVLFEHGVGGFERYGAPPGDLFDLLVADCGLRIFDLAGEGPYSRGQFEDVFTEPIWNFVAR